MDDTTGDTHAMNEAWAVTCQATKISDCNISQKAKPSIANAVPKPFLENLNEVGITNVSVVS